MSSDQPSSGVKNVEGLSADAILPLVYEELRRLASARLCREGKGIEPIQPTSLVHATYLRVVGQAAQDAKAWDSHGHFFAAAAIAMRRILVDRARQRAQLKRGGGMTRIENAIEHAETWIERGAEMIALDVALAELEQENREMYEVVMLRYFAGLSIDATAELLGVSRNTIKRRWAVARLWLLQRIEG